MLISGARDGDMSNKRISTLPTMPLNEEVVTVITVTMNPETMNPETMNPENHKSCNDESCNYESGAQAVDEYRIGIGSAYYLKPLSRPLRYALGHPRHWGSATNLFTS